MMDNLLLGVMRGIPQKLGLPADEACMKFTDDERRSDPRALTAALVEIVDEHDDTSTCVMEDISANGACIHSDIFLAVGMQVTVRAGSIVKVASVKHCKPAMGGFDIGIEFTGGPWPDPIGLPIHWIRVEDH